jgi:hypothetical protein
MKREVAGIVEGVSLSRFVPGLQYEVSASVGRFLIAIDSAAESREPADPSDDEISGSHLLGGVSVDRN